MGLAVWPLRDGETDPQYQRYGIPGMVLSVAGAFIGIPGAFVFLAMAMYGTGALRDWIFGLLLLAFGLWGLWQVVFGARGRPGRLYRDKRR